MDYEKFPLFIFFVIFYVILEFLLLQVFGKSSLLDYLKLIIWRERFDNYWSQVLFEDKTFYIYIFLGLFLFIVYIWVHTFLLFLFFFSYFSETWLHYISHVVLEFTVQPSLAPNSQPQFPTQPRNLAGITSMHHHVILVTLFWCDLAKRT